MKYIWNINDDAHFSLTGGSKLNNDYMSCTERSSGVYGVAFHHKFMYGTHVETGCAKNDNNTKGRTVLTF